MKLQYYQKSGYRSGVAGCVWMSHPDLPHLTLLTHTHTNTVSCICQFGGQNANISLYVFLSSLWAHPKPPPSLIPACILMPGKKRKTRSHKHARLGQSWFHNHSMTSLFPHPPSLSLSVCLSLYFSVLSSSFFALFLSSCCSPLSANQSVFYLALLTFSIFPIPRSLFMCYIFTLFRPLYRVPLYL